MFYILSKVVWFFLSPVNAAIVGIVLASGLAFTRFAGQGRWLGLFCVVVLVLLAFSPLPRILVRPLEDRFPQQSVQGGRIDGIVVLGGAINVARNDIVLNNAAARMTKAMELALAHPEAKFVFTGGGENPLSPELGNEADGARLLYRSLGLPEGRLILEDKSRNTVENAVFTRRLVDPKPGERWVLVTSASHMPRAIGTFRKAGFEIEAFPVDYYSGGGPADYTRPYRKAARGLEIADAGFKEWVGLVTYYLAGYSSALFPKP
ncbi:YdcF family protein [Bosea sp. TWI1241]|uniref:YdcF family protein n=1 Tax=Bosea sp. TWI1241 TaxID=3148904 RepID=UPI003209FE32